jgi:hypothetical protein
VRNRLRKLIVDCTEEAIKAGKGGFGMVGVRMPPVKK